MVETKIIEIDGKKVPMTKVTHEDLPAYVYMKGILDCTGTIGNIADIKKVSSKYAKVEIDSTYYETFNITKDNDKTI